MSFISPGRYYFRATGIDSNGELNVLHSSPKFSNTKEEVIQHKKDYINYLLESKYKDIKITHTKYYIEDYSLWL